MDLKQLSYFVTVIQEGTISGAARKLHLTTDETVGRRSRMPAL